MSDERPPPDDWLTEDPFSDPEDPAARERAERRAAREQKRREKAAKEAGEPPPPPPPPAEPAAPKRTPEQEFWGEDPTPEPEPEPTPAEPPTPAETPLATEPAKPAPPTPEPPPASPEPVPPPKAEPERVAEERSRPAGNAKRAQDPPTEQQPLPPESPSEHPAREPVPVGADPTVPATGEHLVPDPGAPSARGQTSEEWAAVPAARADALDEAFHEEGNPEMSGAARSGRRSGDGGGRRRGGILGALARHPFRIAAVVVVLIVLWFLNGLFEPFHGDGHGRVAVRIPKGASVSEVGDILEKRGVIGGPGLIDASTLFQIRVTLAGKRSDLYAGKFTLQKDMSYGDAINALSKEPKPATRPGIAEILVPPALSRSQVAQLMKEDGLSGSYMKASKKSKLLDPADYGGKDAKSLEGFLFPDTYQVKRKEGVEGVVRRQLAAFKQNIKKVNMKYAKSKNLNVYDVVTIASMIEGEAAKSKEKKKIASVIYNRLHEGMPLQIDATVRFATGNHEKPLSESELESNSPYNTYANSGLPAGPINSPGLESMQAAAHPAKSDYLFYVVNPKGCEEHSFSASEEEFLADVAKYEKAREANGGNAPSSCGE